MSLTNRQPRQEILVPPWIANMTHWLVKSVITECGTSKTLSSLIARSHTPNILWVLGSASYTREDIHSTTTGTGEREVEIKTNNYLKMPFTWTMIASMDTRSLQIIKVNQISIYRIFNSQHCRLAQKRTIELWIPMKRE